MTFKSFVKIVLQKTIPAVRRLLSWTALRRLGETRVFKLTIAMPFVGYVIILNSQIIEFVEASIIWWRKSLGILESTTYDGGVSVWLIVYFGLLFLGIGSLFFQCFCPYIIKEYRSYHWFVEVERKLMTKYRCHALLDYLSKHIHGALRSDFVDLYDRMDRYQAEQDNLDFEYEEGELLELMFFQWRYESGKRPLLRFIVGSLYAAGLLLLALPSINICVDVLRAMAS